MDTKKYGIIIETFEEIASSYGSRGGMEEVNRVALAPIVAKWHGRILDVGCGAGNFIEKYITPGQHEIFTVDFSMNMIGETCGRLREHLGKTLHAVNGMAQALPFARDSFDGAVSVNTLHNMPSWSDIRIAMAEMARVLRPGGLMLVEFRNYNHPVRQYISDVYDLPELPQKAFYLADVREAVERLGFAVEMVVALDGDEPPARDCKGWYAALARRIRRLDPETAPRFAVIARKSNTFKTHLLARMREEAGGAEQ